MHVNIFVRSGISPAKHSPSWELTASHRPKRGSASHRHPQPQVKAPGWEGCFGTGWF